MFDRKDPFIKTTRKISTPKQKKYREALATFEMHAAPRASEGYMPPETVAPYYASRHGSDFMVIEKAIGLEPAEMSAWVSPREAEDIWPVALYEEIPPVIQTACMPHVQAAMFIVRTPIPWVEARRQERDNHFVKRTGVVSVVCVVGSDGEPAQITKDNTLDGMYMISVPVANTCAGGMARVSEIYGYAHASFDTLKLHLGKEGWEDFVDLLVASRVEWTLQSALPVPIKNSASNEGLLSWLADKNVTRAGIQSPLTHRAFFWGDAPLTQRLYRRVDAHPTPVSLGWTVGSSVSQLTMIGNPSAVARIHLQAHVTSAVPVPETNVTLELKPHDAASGELIFVDTPKHTEDGACFRAHMRAEDYVEALRGCGAEESGAQVYMHSTRVDDPRPVIVQKQPDEPIPKPIGSVYGTGPFKHALTAHQRIAAATLLGARLAEGGHTDAAAKAGSDFLREKMRAKELSLPDILFKRDTDADE